ncbi:MAG: DUF4235 domain-containing protein [Actinomycetota bacterium]|jgi:hypothetical protein|nr:DUF4235 domain-containing protein [Actinomycetota bacterium]
MTDAGLEDDLGDTLTAGNPQAWKLTSVLAGLVGTQVGRRGLTTAWRAIRKDDPPLNPLSKETTWGEALAFAVISGAVYGVTRMVLQRAAAGVWARQLGAPPPGLEKTS